ncbi:MAG: tRNA (adenosine(37)-N6)-dimethylallyltransferase MiaA [bacterium]|nr:tRNA (adenosine(37)-N6)-dimethylallyltransferase MiaA [bacterium]
MQVDKNMINEKCKKKKIIVVVGPTSSGKTSLAVKLAEHFNGEIISADSRQVYIGMDLGTGKEGDSVSINLPDLGPQSARVIHGIPQFLIDVATPLETYTVADFQKQALTLIDNFANRGKIPIIVGGTNLYIQALVEGFSIPVTDQRELTIRQELELLPSGEILDKLKVLDQVSFEKINHQNLRRIIRALSVTMATSIPFSYQQKKSGSNFDTIYFGNDLPRQELYQKIDKRVDDRIGNGMIEEVQSLIDSGIPKERLISFGLEYRYITLYLTNEIPSKEEMIEKLKYAIHAYARRQLTWLKNRTPVIWVKNEHQAISQTAKFLAK